MEQLIQIETKPKRRHPDWFKVKLPSGKKYNEVKPRTVVYIKDNIWNAKPEAMACSFVKPKNIKTPHTLVSHGIIKIKYIKYIK